MRACIVVDHYPPSHTLPSAGVDIPCVKECLERKEGVEDVLLAPKVLMTSRLLERAASTAVAQVILGWPLSEVTKWRFALVTRK